MPSHYACHAGMLLYVSQQFRDAAQAERDPRFGAYADMLDRIVGDLMGRDDSQKAKPAPDDWAARKLPAGLATHGLAASRSE